MKYNADVNLRQRAQRKWFILLGCALVAGGLWFRAEQKRKQAAARFAPTASESATTSPAGGTADGADVFLVDEAVRTPFVAPGLGFEEDDFAAESWMVAGHSAPARFGLASSADVYAGGLRFGDSEERGGVAISVSGRSDSGIVIGPEVTDLARPVAPRAPSLPVKSARPIQAMPRQ